MPNISHKYLDAGFSRHYNRHPLSFPSSVIRKGPWKLIETFDPEGAELYHLENDLNETTNLASEQPELVAELRQQLNAWRDDVGVQAMKPNPDYDSSVKLSKKGKKK